MRCVTCRVALFLMFFLLLFSWTDSAAQKAVRFQAAGDYVEVPHSTSLENSEFTIELWFRVLALGDPGVGDGEQTVLDKRDGTQGGDGYNLRLAGTAWPISAFAFVNQAGVGVIGIQMNQWHHLAATQDADSLRLYLDGVLTETVANTYAANSTAPLFIGEFSGYPGGYIGLRGDIDELRIWDHARSQIEIQSNMNGKITGSESGIVAYWDFDSQIGSTIEDRCPNGNDGTLMGNATLVDSDAPVPVVPSTWGKIKTRYDE